MKQCLYIRLYTKFRIYSSNVPQVVTDKLKAKRQTEWWSCKLTILSLDKECWVQFMNPTFLLHTLLVLKNLYCYCHI